MQINNINDNLINDVKVFLSQIDLIDNIEEEILKNGVALYNEGEIIGYVTYETFCEYGLIRYFVFQKSLGKDIIKELFNKLVDNACQNKIEALIAIGKEQEVIDLFMCLEFVEIEFENFIINGDTLKESDFKDAKILKYVINNLNG